MDFGIHGVGDGGGPGTDSPGIRRDSYNCFHFLFLTLCQESPGKRFCLSWGAGTQTWAPHVLDKCSIAELYPLLCKEFLKKDSGFLPHSTCSLVHCIWKGPKGNILEAPFWAWRCTPGLGGPRLASLPNQHQTSLILGPGNPSQPEN